MCFSVSDIFLIRNFLAKLKFGIGQIIPADLFVVSNRSYWKRENKLVKANQTGQAKLIKTEEAEQK